MMREDCIIFFDYSVHQLSREMNDFVLETERFIRQEKLILPGQKVLAGISGGADSTALLLVLDILRKRLGFSLEAVHVEHGIRGRESEEDAAFVCELCARKGIWLHTRHVDVPLLAAGSGETLEEAARNARFAVFYEIADQTGADRIALAHHADDQTETVLLNLCRGSGLKGLSGMSPLRDRIVRPFLEVNREKIEQWLNSQGQTWRTDSTNLKTDQIRNRIRLEVMPLLQDRINSAAGRHIRETARIARQAEEHLEKECGTLEEREITYDPEKRLASVSCRSLEHMDEALSSAVIRRMIARVNKEKGLKDFSYRHINDVILLVRKEGEKKIDLPGGLEAVRQNGHIVIRPLSAAGARLDETVFPDGGRTAFSYGGFHVEGRFLEGEQAARLWQSGIPEKKYTKWLACDTMGDAIFLRGRKNGDYLTVNAAGGKKSLQDYMVDEKIPASERDMVVLVAQGSHVLWVVGHRISYAARVKENTKRILQICAVPEEEKPETGRTDKNDRL